MVQRIKNKILASLKRSERLTRTDMVYLSKGGFWLGLETALYSLSAFILSVGFANLVSKEAFGTYKFALSAIGIIEALALSGISTAVNQSVARGYDRAVITGAREYLKWSFGMIEACLALSIYYFWNENTTIALAVLIGGSLSPLLNATSLYNSLLGGKKLFKKKFIYSAFRNIIPLIVILVTITLTDNPVWIVAAFFGTSTIVSVMLYKHVLKTELQNKEEDLGVISFGKHLSLMNILATISGQLDRILVFHYMGAAQLAIYSFALAMPQQFRQINKIITALLIPKFSNRSLKDISYNIWHKSAILLLFSGGLTLVYILAAPIIYRVFFPEYMDSILYSQIFALVLLTTPTVLFKQALTSHKRKRELYESQIIMPIFKITLVLLLLPRYGIWGGILTILVSELLNFLLSVKLFYRSLKKEDIS